MITEGSDPLVEENQIHSGDDAGVLVHHEAKGTLLRNNMYNHRSKSATPALQPATHPSPPYATPPLCLRLAGWLAGWLAGGPAGWLAGWLAG